MKILLAFFMIIVVASSFIPLHATAINYGDFRSFAVGGTPINQTSTGVCGTTCYQIEWLAQSFQNVADPGTNLSSNLTLTAPGIFLWGSNWCVAGNPYVTFAHQRMSRVETTGTISAWSYTQVISNADVDCFGFFGACVHHAFNQTPTVADTTFIVGCDTVTKIELTLSGVAGTSPPPAADACLTTTDPDTGCVSNRYFNITAEGQSHANATWEPITRAVATRAEINATKCDKGTAVDACVSNGWANLTFEGQSHANATWCPLTGQGCATNSNFTGNFTGNVTDLSAVPSTLASPVLVYVVILGMISLGFLTRNVVVMFVDFLMLFFMVYAVIALPSGVDTNWKNALFTFTIGGAVLIFFRFAYFAFKGIEGYLTGKREAEEGWMEN